VACICDNWQSIFEDPPDALNTQRYNSHSSADFDQEPQCSTSAAELAVASQLRGGEQGIAAGTPTSYL